MNIKKLIHLFLLSIIIHFFIIVSSTHAQFNNFSDNFLSGFSEDGRLKVLLLKLSPIGVITETSAEEFVKAIQRNLSNTNHFTVVGPQELQAHFQNDPVLADCHDISCGIQIGKQFNADKVLVGQIASIPIIDNEGEEVPGFSLSIRLLDVLTNSLDLVDEIQFTNDTMQDGLFQLANRVSKNTELRGHILSINKRNIVIDMGRAQGLKIGDRFVVYNQSPTTSLDGDTLDLEQKNISVAEINRINNFTSDAVIIYRLRTPEEGDLIKTYLSRFKQVQLIADTRRELDTKRRLTKRKKEIILEPEVLDQLTGEPFQPGKIEWQERLTEASRAERRWGFISLAAGISTLIFLTERIKFSDSIHEFVVIGTGAFTGYSIYRFIQSRNLVNSLEAEGYIKKYTSLNYNLQFSPKGAQLAFNYKF